MRLLKTMLKYEARQSLSKLYMIPLLIILALSLGFVQYNVSEYKKSLEKKAIFQNVEMNKIKLYYNYRQYASFGFRLLFLPDPLSILFTNSSVIQNMTSYIDSGDRLNIDKSLKGRSIFEVNKYLFADYSGIFLFFGGLIALFYGYVAFSSKDYQRFLVSINGVKKQFLTILLVRSIMLALFILFFIAAAILLIAINGVAVGIDLYLLMLFMKMYGVALSFLALGSVFGSSKSLILGLSGSITSWFLFLFIFPFLISIIVAAKSNVIKPEYQLDMEKLKLILDFEKRSIEKYGYFDINKDATEIQREIILTYYKNEFQKMQALEEELRTQMHEHTKLYYRLSSFFPTTGYLALTNEISSRGYKTLDAFYQFVLQTKRAFFKEYMKQAYFSSQPAKVEPFLKGDDNVFMGKPALPGYLLQGFIFNILWIVGLLIPSYYRFKKTIFILPEKKKEAQTPKDVELQRGTFKSWKVFGGLFYRQMYNLLSSDTAEFKKKGYTFQVSLDDQVLNTATKKQNFIALSHPTEIPENFKVSDFTRLIMDLLRVDKVKRKEIETLFSLTSFQGKRFNQLDMDELGQVFLAILDMKPFDIYLLNDVSREMPLDFCLALKDRMDELRDSGALVLFLYSSTDNLLVKSAKSAKYFVESYHWGNMVESCKGLNDDETDA